MLFSRRRFVVCLVASLAIAAGGWIADAAVRPALLPSEYPDHVQRPARYRNEPSAPFRAQGPAMHEQKGEDARALLQRVIQAKGGIDRLRSIRTLSMAGSMTVMVPAPHSFKTASCIQYPDRFRQDAKLPGGDVTQVYSGGEAWMRDASGVHDIPSPTKENLAATVSRDVVLLLLGGADGRLRVAFEPGRQADAKAVDTLRLSGAGASPVELLVDRGSAMIVAKRYIVEQPGAVGKVPTVESYSDYRQVDGVQVAFKTVVRRGQAVILEQSWSEFRINVPLDETLFKRPVQGAAGVVYRVPSR